MAQSRVYTTKLDNIDNIRLVVQLGGLRTETVSLRFNFPKKRQQRNTWASAQVASYCGHGCSFSVML